MTLPLMEVPAPHVTILYGTRSKIQIPVYRNQRTRMFDVNACVQISSPLKKVGKRDLPYFFRGVGVFSRRASSLFEGYIVKSRRARRCRARFALLAQIGELAMLRVSTKAIDQFYIVQKK